MSCIFCKIVSGEIPSTKIYDDGKVVGFKDLNPLAPVHNLFIHHNHHKDVNEMVLLDGNNLIDIYKAISEWSKQAGLDQSGFRIVTNLGKDAGQTVFHAHFHVLGGTTLKGFGA
jgi:histidine triad (HIT) family protein